MMPDTLAPDTAENAASDGTKFTVHALSSLLQGKAFFSGVRSFYVCRDVKYLTFFRHFSETTLPITPFKKTIFPVNP